MPRLVIPRTAKQAFVTLFATVPSLLGLHAAWRAARAPRSERAGWALLAWVHAVPAALFGGVFLRPKARTTPDLIGAQALGAAGVLASLRFARRHPLAWALAAAEVPAWLAYVRWYSRFGREPAPALAIGAELPADLPFVEHGRGAIAAAELRGKPTVFLFYRGNWCPLCMAQVGEIAERWREVEALGAQVALVSPQHEGHTRDLAARHEGDTVLPTLVVTDAAGRIVFADQTDNYRVRPTPDTVLAALAEAGLGTESPVPL